MISGHEEKAVFLPQFVKLRAFESTAYVARISAIPVEVLTV
jgi:hypothetical protein